jgi:hypothetical protein
MDDYASILDRSKYTKQTLDLFEVIGAYYTQIFYIHFYEEGKGLKINDKVYSFTEGYRQVVKHFLVEYEKHNVFKRFLNDLCEYYIECGFPHVLLTDFVHLVVREFLPADYFRGISKHQCSVIVFKIFSAVVRDFCVKILTDYIEFIIDGRNDRDKPRIIQDEFIDMLLLERHRMFTKITNIEIKSDRSVDMELVRRLQATVKKMIAEMQKFQVENKKLKIMLVKLNKEKVKLEEENLLKDKKNAQREEELQQQRQMPVASSPLKTSFNPMDQFMAPRPHNTTGASNNPFDQPNEKIEDNNTYIHNEHAADDLYNIFQ